MDNWPQNQASAIANFSPLTWDSFFFYVGWAEEESEQERTQDP